MIAILRQLEDIHKISPNSAQKKAEDELGRVRASEAEWLEATVRREEVEAGLAEA